MCHQFAIFPVLWRNADLIVIGSGFSTSKKVFNVIVSEFMIVEEWNSNSESNIFPIVVPSEKMSKLAGPVKNIGGTSVVVG